MGASSCRNDGSFGPVVQGCRDDFDFTLRFQHIVLAIVPAALFLALSIPRTIWLSQQPRIVSGAAFQFAKLTVITILATLQFALLNLQTAGMASDLDPFAITATTLNLVAALSMLALSFYEHSRVPRPSTLLILYVLLQILCDVAQVRTSWLMVESVSSSMIARLFTASVVVKFIILVAEAQRKSRWLRWKVDDHSPEETSGVLSLSVYFWLNRLFRQGYSNILSVDDLYPLDQDIDSDLLQRKLAAAMALSPPGRTLGLVRSLARALCVPFLMPVAPQVALIGFTFSQPLFIRALLEFLQQPDAPRSTSYGLIGAAVLIYSGAAFARALHWYFHTRALSMTRGCLSASIYKKTTETKLADAGDAAAVTLMSTDTDRVVLGLTQLHNFWSSPIEIGIGCWFLERELGTSFVAPIILILICAIGTSVIGKLSGGRQVRWMSQIQKRVGLTANVISNMKNLKISGITLPVGELIQKMRVEEMDIGNRSRWLLIWAVVAAMTPAILSPVVALAFTTRELDTTTMFTSISFLILLTSPLSQLFQAVPMLFAGLASLGRIQTFIEADARDDIRQHGAPNSSGEKPFSDGPSRSEPEFNEKANLDSALSGAASAITIRDGCFGWVEDKMTLHHVNLRFPVSKLTVVVGPTAAGKSTLCNVLLGEVPFSRGRVIMPFARAAIGYCEQSPFLWNATIKENIIGYSKYNQPRYEEVVEACMLISDFTILPQGDETNIGSNGIALSGGQKQRVSLARALYLESDLMLSDDILSGLDNDTASEVFRRVFGFGGILRRRNATAILCTHSVRHLPLADHIIALDVGGTIVEEGSFEDLMQNKKYVANLNIAASSDDETEEEADAPMPTSTTAQLPTRQRLPSKQIVPDEHSRQTGDTKVYGHYMRALSKWSLIVLVTSAAIHAFCNNMATAWLKFWSEDTFDRPSNFYLGIFGLLKGGHSLTSFIVCVTIIVWITTQSGTTLHHQALDTVVHAPLSFFTTTDLGIVTNLFSQDMTLIDGELPLALLNTVIDIFQVMGMTAVVGTASPYLAISYPVFAAVLWVIQKFYLRTSRQLRLLDLEAKSPLYTHFLDTIKGISTFRAFGWTEENVAHNQSLLNTSQRPSYLLAMIQRWLSLTMEILVVIIAIIIVSLATQTRGNSGFTGASLVTLMSLSDTITWLIRNYTALETSIGAVSRIKTFSETVVSENREHEDIQPPMEWPQTGNMELKDVSASYSTNVEDIGNGTVLLPSSLVLKNVNLSIKAGQKVALCGRSGSGKSSLILVLLRLLDPLPSCSQSMEVDGIPFHRIDRDVLRRRIIAVPQDAVFLPSGSSIKDNLDPFNTATDLECQAVLDTVLLNGFLSDMGGNVHTGMSTDSLSAGQRQLFSLGRAILRRRVKDRNLGGVPRGGILLLDEVSSNVDRETDRIMQGIIKEEFSEYTIVMVSHRLDMVIDFFDEVVVVDKGEVVETGDPRSLVSQEGSRFGQLWAFENKYRA